MAERELEVVERIVKTIARHAKQVGGRRIYVFRRSFPAIFWTTVLKGTAVAAMLGVALWFLLPPTLLVALLLGLAALVALGAYAKAYLETRSLYVIDPLDEVVCEVHRFVERRETCIPFKDLDDPEMVQTAWHRILGRALGKSVGDVLIKQREYEEERIYATFVEDPDALYELVRRAVLKRRDLGARVDLEL